MHSVSYESADTSRVELWSPPKLGQSSKNSQHQQTSSQQQQQQQQQQPSPTPRHELKRHHLPLAAVGVHGARLSQTLHAQHPQPPRIHRQRRRLRARGRPHPRPAAGRQRALRQLVHAAGPQRRLGLLQKHRRPRARMEVQHPPAQPPPRRHGREARRHHHRRFYKTGSCNFPPSVLARPTDPRKPGMPDALSTTIPIWCAVLNAVLLPEHPLSSQLFLPPHLLDTTHAQITALLPRFVASLRALRLPPGRLPSLSKPLRPFWLTRDSALRPPDTRDGGSCTPVFCLTASRRVTSASEGHAHGYIQGAADDSENWARGLVPSVFWANKDLLLSACEGDLPSLIASLLREADDHVVPAPAPVHLTPFLSVCALPVPAGSACCVSLTSASTPKEAWIKSVTCIDVGLGRHKTASRNLRTALPDICAFVSSYLQRNPQGRVTVACESGKDASVGAALALSCYLFDDEGTFRVPHENMQFTKTLVKTRLGSIMTVYPGGNPSRQTLQSVNSFLMDWTKQ